MTKYAKIEDKIYECNKLGQLEDIDEELGIELITLFKALKGGIYANNHSKIEYFNEVSIRLDSVRDAYITAYSKQPVYSVFADKIKNYGSTWALTKEELEYGKRNKSNRIYKTGKQK